MGRKSIAEERRTQIIQAFYRCTVSRGAARASIRNIACEANVSPSTLHHYFKNREEIIEESVVYFADLIFAGFRDQMAGEKEVAQARFIREGDLYRGLEFIFSKGMINEEYTGFFLECCVAARNNSRVRHTIADLFLRFRLAIIDLFDQEPGFSSLPLGKKQMLAAMVVAIHEGIELQWFADPGAVRLDQALKTCRELIGFFIHYPEKP